MNIWHLIPCWILQGFLIHRHRGKDTNHEINLSIFIAYPWHTRLRRFSKYSFFCICLAKINGKEVGKTGVEVNGNDKAISNLFFFFNKFIYLFIYFWLCWVFVSALGLSPVAASGGHSSSQHTGLSLSRPLLLRSTGSVVVAHGSSCSAACGIFPDQSSNPCPLHWQADSQPLRHQGSPISNL